MGYWERDRGLFLSLGKMFEFRHGMSFYVLQIIDLTILSCAELVRCFLVAFTNSLVEFAKKTRGCLPLREHLQKSTFTSCALCFAGKPSVVAVWSLQLVSCVSSCLLSIRLESHLLFSQHRPEITTNCGTQWSRRGLSTKELFFYLLLFTRELKQDFLSVNFLKPKPNTF